MSETILSKLEGQVAAFQQFSDQYSNYMTDLMGGVSKEVSGITEKIVQQLQGQLSGWSQSLNNELAGSIGSVSASVAKEVTGMGESIIKELGQSSQNLINEIGKMTGDQNSTIENIGNVLKELEDVNKMTSNTSSDMVQKFESLFQLLSNLAGKQDRLVGAVTQSIEQMSSQEGLHRKSLEEFTKSVSSQAEILEAFNSGIDKVTNGNMFKDTLEGIRSGIETIKPELQLLATNISNASKKSS
jgi:methyl-accepting chemotaxis protein